MSKEIVMVETAPGQFETPKRETITKKESEAGFWLFFAYAVVIIAGYMYLT